MEVDSDSDSDKSAASDASERSASDKSASEKSASEKSASEKSASEKSASEQSSSAASDSDSGDASSNSDGGSSARPPARTESRRKTARNSEIKEAYEENPDVYGIRRSGRERKEPERLTAKEEAHRAARNRKRSSAVWGSSDSASDSDASERPRPSRRPGGGGGGGAASKRPSARRPAARRRQLSESSDSASDSDHASRAIGRRTGSRVNYQEAEEEATDEEDLMEVDAAALAAAEQDNGETVERVLKDRVGKVGATGASTTVYAVEENGDPNADFDPEDGDQSHETQYWLKWKGWSHLHNTWESEATLKAQGVKGLKKIDNFRKRQDEVKAYLNACEPEDAEYFVCQNELQDRLVASYLEVDRIIGEGPKPGHEYPDYLVKWDNLPYSECTWEDGTLIAKKFEHRIDEFVSRSQSRKTPTKLNPVLRRRPKFVSFSKQPSFFGGVSGDLRLRDYQLDGVNWMVHSWCRENSVILADEMGLGKTIQTTCFMYYLFNQHALFGPYLVVVPLSTLPAWQRELAKWAPEMNVVTYLGDVSSREKIRHYEWCFPGNKRLKFNVLLTSYEILLKDKSFLGAISWAALLVDEAHRLKNEESLLYKTLFEFNTNHRLLITGTPLQNSLKELWSLLHFIMPQRFDRWENFEVDMDQGSKAYARLHKLLEPFLLRRVKKDVEKSLPAKVEQILRVGMTSQQRQYYKWILTRNYTMLKKGLKAAAPSLVNVIMELKKCCNHGYLTKPPDPEVRLGNNEALQGLLRNSGKLMLLDKLLVRLRERGHRVLIFSQMVRMLDLLADYLQLRHFPFQRLDGGMRGDLRRQALDHFNAEGSQDFCFLLSTRAGGLGINLATADTVIIYDSDWNPQNDLQAQSRAHRIGQKNQVNIYRLVTMQSIEEDIIERAKRKMVLDHLVIQSMDSTGRTVLKKGASTTTPFNKDELNAILKFGAEELFSKDKDEEEDDDTTCDIDLILQRAETREEEPDHAPGNDLLSAFKVASFQVEEDEVASLPATDDSKPPSAATAAADEKDWDDIIPSDLREKVEAEDRQREVEDLYLPPRSRKTVQAAAAEDDERDQRRKRRHDASDDADSDSEQAKKKPRRNMRERVKGFTDGEVRRFFKAFRRFGCPLERLEAISTEAELQEKSLSDLRRLGETIIANCHEAMQQQQAAKDNGAAAEAENGEAQKAGGRKKRECGPSFRLSGVAINAKTTLQTLEDLEPLHRAMPADVKQRRHWRLEPVNGRVKDTHWDVDWGLQEDSRLLQGVYEYGTGAWESIKIDPSLHLEEKILLEQAESKPQAKQLQTRTDYLLKVLRKQQLAQQPSAAAKKPKRPATARSKKAVSREIIEGDDISSDENTQSSLLSSAKDVKDHHKDHHKEHHKDHQKDHKEQKDPKEHKDGKELKDGKDGVKKEVKKRKKKAPAPPMHFTANHEPVQVSSTEELPEAVFLECKEKMRPVKRALKALDSPDPSLSDSEQVNHTRQCLIQIGSHIDRCLRELHQPDKIKEWRSNLWHFVSQFTEFDPRKLYKLYKHAVKKMGGSAAAAAAAAAAPAPVPHHHHHHHEERAGSKDKDRTHHKDKKKKKRDSPEPGGGGRPAGGDSEPRAAPAPARAGDERRRTESAGAEPPAAAPAPAQRHGDDDDRDRSGKRDRPRHSEDRGPRDRRDWRREYPAGSGGGHGSPGGPPPHRNSGYGDHRDGYSRDRDRSRDRERDYRQDGYHHGGHHGGGYRGWQQHGRPPSGYDRHGGGYGGYGRHYGGEERWRERSSERPDPRWEERRPPPSAGS